LGGPSQEDLRGGLVVLLGDLHDRGVVEEERGVLGRLELQLQEGLGSKGRVCGDGDALGFRKLQESGLHEVWVVLDLESGRADLGVSEQVDDQRTLEVGNTNGLRVSLVDQALHSSPGLLDRSTALLHIVLPINSPSGRVSHGRVDVFESDGEVHDVQVEVVNAPVRQLPLADGLDSLAIVEGVPQLAD